MKFCSLSFVALVILDFYSTNAVSAPTKKPTTAAQFKWQAGIYWQGQGINTLNTKMFNVYYGNWAMTTSGTYSNCQTAAIIDQFCVDLGRPGNAYNSWYSIMSTYWDGTKDVPRNSTLVGSYFVNTTNYPTSINQHDIEATILGANIKAGKIPATNGKNSYNFFPSEDVRIDKVETGYATADCSTICGFHSYTTVVKGTSSYRTQYTVQANQASKNKLAVQCGCTWYGGSLMQKSPNGNYIADSFIYILSHEISELVTDSDRGWSNCPGCDGEVGDRCIWRTGTPEYNGDFLYRSVTNSYGYAVKGNMVGLSARVYHVNPTWVNHGNGCCAVSWPFEYDKGQVYRC